MADAFRLDARARRINGDLVPRSGPARRSQDQLHRGPDQEPPHGPQRRRRAAGQRSTRGATRRVVIGAHYDHVGMGGRLSVSPERVGQIHNGADDNASGTSAIIEMARVAAADRGAVSALPRLRRVRRRGARPAGLGALHGRRGPCRSTNTIAMLNLDMVGRARGSVDVSGLDASPSMEQDLETAAQGGQRARRSSARVRATGAATTRRSSTGACRRSTSSPDSTPTTIVRPTTGSGWTCPARRRWPRSRWSWPPAVHARQPARVRAASAEEPRSAAWTTIPSPHQMSRVSTRRSRAKSMLERGDPRPAYVRNSVPGH